MTEEKVQELKKLYPNITKEEVGQLPVEDWNKMRIFLLEFLVKEYKDRLQDAFKTSKSWLCSDEDKEWYKNLLRDEKNKLELTLKEVVQEQTNLREGLNPPFCFKKF